MQIGLFIIIAILLAIISCQQFYIHKQEDRLYNALRVTCETLNLIRKGEEIL